MPFQEGRFLLITEQTMSRCENAAFMGYGSSKQASFAYLPVCLSVIYYKSYHSIALNSLYLYPPPKSKTVDFIIK